MNLYQCEPQNSTMRYFVLAENPTEALNKVRHATNVPKDVPIAIVHKEYIGWFIF